MNKYIGVVLLFALFSCNSATENANQTQDSTAVQVDSTATSIALDDQQVQEIYNHYIILKDALVATNFEQARPAASELSAKLAGYAGCENTALIAKKIAEAKNIADQRKEFTFLSSDIIALFKHADLTAGTIYVQRCPMANNGDGGEWLASEKQIQNPYYGDEMMDCGAVLEEIHTK
ncbi:hypothetical protein IWX76_000267 [Pedobacter sp. CAN_A7]|uniref:DUF3347 domain-containing protein n=1 Tax=Pedobacter sp. CAN_A7 TaxID=2787722 RepID=UPI0018CA7DBA